MRSHGQAAIYQLLDDNLVFRDLHPVDPRLPAIDELRAFLKIQPGVIPRKADAAYAGVMAEILRAAHRVNSRTTPARLLFIGDTEHNDAALFKALCRYTGWRGRAFIADEGHGTASAEARPCDNGEIIFANRWGLLDTFVAQSELGGFGVDEDTIVAVDIDKTLIGARGRNDHVIDQARLEAAIQTANAALGESMSAQRFEAAYLELNRPNWHPFTHDNQDVVVYVGMLVAADLVTLPELTAMASGAPGVGLRRLLDVVNRRIMPDAFRALHSGFQQRFNAGEVTILSKFRRMEFQTTVKRMGCIADSSTPEEMLRKEIVLTEEVWSSVLRWKTHGCTALGLSDKPKEACFPEQALNSLSMSPLHHTFTHVVGSDR